MKKVLFITVLLLSVMFSYGQLYKIECNDYSIMENPFDEDTQWGEWEDCNILIVLDADRSKITIDNKWRDVFTILKFGKFEDEIDNFGNACKLSCLSLYDQNGISIRAIFKMYDETIQILFYYNDIAYGYSGVLTKISD